MSMALNASLPSDLESTDRAGVYRVGGSADVDVELCWTVSQIQYQEMGIGQGCMVEHLVGGS